jgi:hypothetical protein
MQTALSGKERNFGAAGVKFVYFGENAPRRVANRGKWVGKKESCPTVTEERDGRELFTKLH